MPTIIADEFTGETTEYLYLSERLPLFYERYPPTEGWSVRIEMTDGLSVRPGLLSLAQAAIERGKSLEDVGMGPDAAKMMVAKATLTSPNDRVIATATAARPILEFKDWERLETAARQRLVAALGFDGSLLNEEEEQAIREIHEARRQRTQERSEQYVEASTPPAAAAVPPATPQKRPKPKAKAADPEPEPATQQPTVEQTPPPVTIPAIEAPEGVPAGLLRTIETMAKKIGQDVPKVENLEQAQAALAALTAR